MRQSIWAIVYFAVFISGAAHAATDIPKDILSQRDPFKRPEVPHEDTPKSDLEQYAADQFKLQGVLSGGKELRAMVAAPNGRTYFVRPGMVMGLKKGVIRKISETALYVRERVTNVLGQQEDVETVLKLPSDNGEGTKSLSSGYNW